MEDSYHWPYLPSHEAHDEQAEARHQHPGGEPDGRVHLVHVARAGDESNQKGDAEDGVGVGGVRVHGAAVSHECDRAANTAHMLVDMRTDAALVAAVNIYNCAHALKQALVDGRLPNGSGYLRELLAASLRDGVQAGERLEYALRNLPTQGSENSC